MTRPPPTVSVVVPTYDRLPFLRQAVESVLGQSHPHWELLVVDDGSGDGTVEYVHTLADARVRLLPLSHSGNVARLRNEGARAARGEFLTFLDSDDVWLPRKLEVQLERMERGGARWSYTRYEHIDAEGRPVPWRAGGWGEVSGWIAVPLISMEMAVCICTVMVERRLFEAVGGFDESPVLREDLDLTLRLAVAADAVAVPETLVQIREHESRSTRAFTDPFERTLAVYDRAARRVRDPELRPVLRRQRAHLCVEAAAHRLAGRHFIRGLLLLARAALLRARPREIAWALFRGDRPA